MELQGSNPWQEVVLPSHAGNATSAYMRLVPVDGAVR